SAADTLIGANVPTTWSLTGSNAGKLGTVFFDAFANLTGGTAGDTFKFSPVAGVTGLISGGSGTDKLDYSAYGSAVTVNLKTMSAPGAGAGFSSFESFVGSAATDTLIAPDTANAWQVTANNAGKLNTFSFAGVE